MHTLLIGGTRNLGPSIVAELRAQNHTITILNRGQTPDDLPKDIERLHADRSNRLQLAQTLHNRNFDAVIDTTLYNAIDADHIAELLHDRTQHYIFLSTGQVYLVRENLNRPFTEEMYDGPTIPEPADRRDFIGWLYGIDKRAAEDALIRARAARNFPYTTLRLPMVNSERDHFHRILNYFLRLKDGGPILIPAGTHLPLRHVYGEDVVQAILAVLKTPQARGRAYNISQDETVSIDEFLGLLAITAGVSHRTVALPRETLDSQDLMPDCSHFSDPWMSALDNTRSKNELGMKYTSLGDYLYKIVAHYETHPPQIPAGYGQREKELAILK